MDNVNLLPKPIPVNTNEIPFVDRQAHQEIVHIALKTGANTTTPQDFMRLRQALRAKEVRDLGRRMKSMKQVRHEARVARQAAQAQQPLKNSAAARKLFS